MVAFFQCLKHCSAHGAALSSSGILQLHLQVPAHDSIVLAFCSKFHQLSVVFLEAYPFSLWGVIVVTPPLPPPQAPNLYLGINKVYCCIDFGSELPQVTRITSLPSQLFYLSVLFHSWCPFFNIFFGLSICYSALNLQMGRKNVTEAKISLEKYFLKNI